MKTRLMTVILIALAAVTVSCGRETEEPKEHMNGKFALDIPEMLADGYYLFDDKDMTIYEAQDRRVFAENAFWNCSESDFEIKSSSEYYIQGGRLYVEGQEWGSFTDDWSALVIGNDYYSAVKSFKSECYPSLSVNPSDIVLPYIARTSSVPVTVNRPIPSGTLSASTSETWLTNVAVTDGLLVFDAAETNADRSGEIILKYDYAEDCVVSVRQHPSTFIRLAVSEGEYNYARQSASFEVTVDNPVDGSVLSASTQADWIFRLTVDGGTVSFDLGENNSSNSRSATVTLSYSGAADVSYTVTQTWDKTVIVLTSETKDVEYTGGTYTVPLGIENPRWGSTTRATTSDDWISDITVSDNSLSFKVAGRESGKSRTGTISLVYGAGTSNTTYAKVVLTVTQAGYPATSLTLSFNSILLFPQQGSYLVATVVPSDSELIWSSDHPEIATVNSSGLVMGVAVGNATVTVASKYGNLSASCAVRVIKRSSPLMVANEKKFY